MLDIMKFDPNLMALIYLDLDLSAGLNNTPQGRQMPVICGLFSIEKKL